MYVACRLNGARCQHVEKGFASLCEFWRMKQHLLLFYHLLKYSIINRLEYRFDFLLNTLQSFGWLLVSLLSLEVIFSRTPLVAGWSKSEVFTLYGIFMAINTLWVTLFSSNLPKLSKFIQQGDFDFILLKPVSSQFLISLKEITVSTIPSFIVSFFIIFHYARLGSKIIGVGTYMITAALMVNGLIVLYSLILLVTTLSFWVVRMHAFWEFYILVTEGARYPISFFRNPLRFIFTFIIPLLVIFTIPAQTLVKATSIETILISFMIGAVLFTLSNRFFYFGIKHYNSASS